jgi:hypothetical protein
MFQLRDTRDAPTYAQLGDATDPAAHAAGQVVDDPRDVLNGGAYPDDEPGLSPYVYRQPGSPVTGDNVAPADGAAGLNTAGVHASHGQADGRRQWTSLTTPGYPELPERTSTTTETISRQPHGAVEIPGVTPLTVNKAGSQSADPAHVAGMPRYLYDRPFDQAIAHHPPEVSKLGMPSPLASAPIHQTVGTPGGQPSPGGVDGTTAWQPVTTWRNTVRKVPRPADETAIVGTTETAVPARRWRL